MSIPVSRSTGRRERLLAIVAAVVGVGLASTAIAHEPSKHADGAAHASPPKRAGDAGQVEVKLLDLGLVDRDGSPVKFKSEAVADRIVAIDFVYTTCTTVCPVLSAVFAQVQEELGDRLGEEVRLVSISIDPTRDTPRRMAAKAREFDAGPGWLWLTGRKDLVDRVLGGLDAYTPAFEEHASMILIGDARRGVWRRLFGFPAPGDIVAIIDELAAARGTSKTNVKLGN